MKTCRHHAQIIAIADYIDLSTALGIHVFDYKPDLKTSMAGTSPAMTNFPHI